MKTNGSLSVIALCQDLGLEIGREIDCVSGTNTLAGPNQDAPLSLAGIESPKQENFDLRACVAVSPPYEARRKNACVVEHETIAPANIFVKVRERVIEERLSRAGDDQHPRGGTIGKRFLGD